MRKKIFLKLFIIFIILQACHKNEGLKKSQVQGIVLDSDGKTPIAGAKIFAGSMIATTDKGGKFTIADFENSSIIISVFANGYNPKTSTFVLVKGQNNLPPIILTQKESKEKTEEIVEGTGEKTEEGKTIEKEEKKKTLKSDLEISPAQIITYYYNAIDSQNYKKAARYRFGVSAKKLQKQYKPYIKSVSVTKATKMPRLKQDEVCFNVVFKATYIKEYPAGSGQLPNFHCLKQDRKGNWKISQISTGP